MALVRNGRTFFQNPGKFTGAAYTMLTGNFIKGGLRNRNVGGFNSTFNAYPNGALAPNAFILPQKSGSIASYTLASGAITGTSNLTPALPMLATGALTITVTSAQLDQVIQLIASGVLSITGSGNIAAAVSVEADGSMTITVTDSTLGGIFPAAASGTLSITGSASTLTALAFMEASAGGATPLSPEGLAFELLDNQDIDTGYSLRDALKLILSATAGKVSGAETTTITFRNLPDSIDRIVATVDANGNRTSLTYDVGD